MSGRRNANRIRGPQSALTDFLAANNISAAQIRDSYEQRAQEAEERNANENARAEADEEIDELEEEQAEEEDEESEPQPRRSNKRKRATEKEKEKAKVKKSKKDKKKKGKKDSDDDDSDDEWNENSLGRDMYRKSKPRPGQLENCEICEKRFTVTPYSKEGPEGGLLCNPCGRELVKDNTSKEKKPKKQNTGKSRRKVESNRLDGIVGLGAKSLQQICIERIAHHHHDLDEFGDIPEDLLDRLSEIFSKNRLIDPRTLQLFLRPDLNTVAIHDCAKLETEDYPKIFGQVQGLETIVLRNCGQVKDSTIDYMLEKAPNIKFLQLYGANLVSKEKWFEYFERHGAKLEAVKLQWLDSTFDDDVVQAIANNCTNLNRLKIKYCQKVTPGSLPAIKSMNLEHLSLRIQPTQDGDSWMYYDIISELGRKLKTLSLENLVDGDHHLIKAIRTNCRSLNKLRITEMDQVTSSTLTELFEPSNDPIDPQPTTIPPLRFLDLSGCRDVDNNNPEGSTDSPIGLNSTAFKALMEHSGSTLEILRIPSCRHIEHSAFCDVFGPESNYPKLKELNLSFCSSVDTSVIEGIFRTCPHLKKLIAFGCFKIDDVDVPKGVALIGVPKAGEGVEQFGGGVDFGELMDVLGGTGGDANTTTTAGIDTDIPMRNVVEGGCLYPFFWPLINKHYRGR